MQVDLLYRPANTLARCRLGPAESVAIESGALVGMSPNLEVEPQPGGVVTELKRLLGGEWLSRSTLTARDGAGEVLLATPLRGDMAVLEVGERQWRIQGNAYVASSPAVEVKKRALGLRGVLSGAGLSVMETAGRGLLILGAFGALEEVPVDGQILVDTGHLAAWESTLTYRTARSTSSWLAAWLSDEALVWHVEGRGSLWVQSRSASLYGAALGAALPPRKL